MRLSQIQQSKSILPDENLDCGGSWGIFLSPERPDHVIKLFYDEQQFNDEKTGYDKVLGEPSLIRFANQYSVISVQLDTSTYTNNRMSPPFNSALLIQFLSNPPWKIIGKLGSQETDDKLVSIGVNVEELKDHFCQIGIASWEATFFMHSITREIKGVDFTYSEVILNSNVDMDEQE